MQLKLEHSSIMVTDLDKTLAFFDKALAMKEVRRKEGPDRVISFVGSDIFPHQIEVLCMKEHPEKHDQGDNPTHIAFRADDIDEAKAYHQKIGVFHHELPEFGVYFIADPDGYLYEIMPTRKK